MTEYIDLDLVLPVDQHHLSRLFELGIEGEHPHFWRLQGVMYSDLLYSAILETATELHSLRSKRGYKGDFYKVRRVLSAKDLKKRAIQAKLARDEIRSRAMIAKKDGTFDEREVLIDRSFDITNLSLYPQNFVNTEDGTLVGQRATRLMPGYYLLDGDKNPLIEARELSSISTESDPQVSIVCLYGIHMPKVTYDEAKRRAYTAFKRRLAEERSLSGCP